MHFPKKSKHLIFGPFLTIFGHFYRKEIFPKKSDSITHISILVPNTIQSFRKKIMSQYQENCWKNFISLKSLNYAHLNAALDNNATVTNATVITNKYFSNIALDIQSSIRY